MTESATATVSRVVLSATRALESASEDLCRLDAAAGDGDHGLTMENAAKSIRMKLAASEPQDLATLTELLAAEFAGAGGAMGALTYVLVNAVAATIDESEPFSASALARFLTAAQQAVTTFGGARPGDKSMVDAIDAARARAEECAHADASAADAMLQAAAAAQQGAMRTAQYVPRVGRASRLGDKSLGTVDPGAQTVAIVLGAMARAYVTEPSAGTPLTNRCRSTEPASCDG